MGAAAGAAVRTEGHVNRALFSWAWMGEFLLLVVAGCGVLVVLLCGALLVVVCSLWWVARVFVVVLPSGLESRLWSVVFALGPLVFLLWLWLGWLV